MIKDGSFQYGANDPKPILEHINLEVPRGQLIAVVGTVGTGKSTLLNALLGDIVKTSGTVTVSVSEFEILRHQISVVVSGKFG